MTCIRPAFDALDTVYRMVADAALYKLYSEVESPEDKVIIQGAPKVRLIASKDIAVGELTLVPWTQNVQVKPINSHQEWRTHVTLKTEPPRMFVISSPNGLGKKIDIEFWRMQFERKDAKLANMSWALMTKTMQWPIDIGLGKTVDVAITVAKNSKVIKSKHEVRGFAALPTKTNQMTITMTELGDAKRHKTEE